MRIKNETGRTLLEMTGVLAIIGVLVIGSVSGLRFGITWMQVSSVYSIVENTTAGVIDIYSWKKDYPLSTEGKIMAEKIIKSGDVCSECVATVNGAELKLPWNSKMVIQPGDATYFKVILQNVPKSACLRLKEMDWNYVRWQSPVDEVEGHDKPACSDGTGNIVFYAH